VEWKVNPGGVSYGVPVKRKEPPTPDTRVSSKKAVKETSPAAEVQGFAAEVVQRLQEHGAHRDVLMGTDADVALPEAGDEEVYVRSSRMRKRR
jgi:hypothetical protein